MINAAVIGLGRWGKNIVDAVQGKSKRLRFIRGVSKEPELVRDFVRDLYKYEIRQLRERLLKGEFPRDSYAMRVEELRRRYPVLSLRAQDWLE